MIMGMLAMAWLATYIAMKAAGRIRNKEKNSPEQAFVIPADLRAVPMGSRSKSPMVLLAG